MIASFILFLKGRIEYDEFLIGSIMESMSWFLFLLGIGAFIFIISGGLK